MHVKLRMLAFAEVGLFCVSLFVAVHCQPYPRFELHNRVILNNSYVLYSRIGVGDNALNCTTNSTSCCTYPDTGNWTDGRGRAVHEGMDRATTVYMTREDRVVSLNRITGWLTGLWRCDIPDSSGVMQSIYIYICNTNSCKSHINTERNHTLHYA